MNKYFKFMAVALIGLLSVSAYAINFSGKHYQGIGKVAGHPLDYWVTLEMDAEDAEVSVGQVYNFMGAYTATGSGDSSTLTIAVPSSPKATLKTTDGGSTLTGNISLDGKKIDLWLLQVPRKLKETQKPSEELMDILASPDGYTCFVQLRQSGGVLCVTSDFNFNNEGRFNIVCDNPQIQEMFENIKGSYSVEGSNVVLTTDKGPVLKGTIYDDGNYLIIPVGAKGGMDMTLVLIR